ncbi:hypothetical protein ACHAXN_008574 [Cyclotella atomus]
MVSAYDTDDSDSYLSSASSDEAPHATIAATPPRGKELRLPSSYQDDNDNDDTSMPSAVPVGPPRGKELRLLINDTDEPQPPSSSSKPAKNKSSPRKPAKKRKAPPLPPPEEDSDEDAVAAIVVQEDDVAVAEVVNVNPKRPKKKAKTRPKKKTTGVATAVPVNKFTAKPESIKAASAAREELHSKVTSLPYSIGDYCIIRCLGRLDSSYDPSKESKGYSYSKADALYPIGFSVDRYDYSPVHGRVIKIRCEILDGRLLKLEKNEPNGHRNSYGVVDQDLGDGPVFRVMWGEGIDADDDTDTTTPISFPSDTSTSSEKPTVGTRVSVRFDNDEYYQGKITKVNTSKKTSTQYNTNWNITILYDDGVVEHTSYPDPDIRIYPPGIPPIEPQKGYVTELHGKSVHSILAKSPLEAWGGTLLSLGLIDEVIYEEAMRNVDRSREEALEEARDRIEGRKKKVVASAVEDGGNNNGENSVKHGHGTRQSTDSAAGMAVAAAEEEDANTESKTEGMEDDAMKVEEDPSEPPTEEEVQLREKLTTLKNELSDAKKESRAVSVDLARARISTISPFAANPFLCGSDAVSQDQSLMAAAVKKEKSKMGNTGNRRKVVTPATMLDRSDTFFTTDIEHLIEGLTNSELAPLYVFHANRSAFTSSQAWVYEAKIRHQKAIQKKLEKEQRIAAAAAEEVEVKATVVGETRASKRSKVKDEEVSSKKRQGEGEEELKKREKVEKRLAQLSLQMDERLGRESYFSIERAITLYVKALNKEFARRRKVADAVIAHKMDQLLLSSSENKTTAFPSFTEKLPPLSTRLYDEEVVRIWDFLHCFSAAFVTENSNNLPTIDSLQDAVDELKKGRSDSKEHQSAVALMEGIAITLCKAISPGLTKYLAAAAYISDPSNKVSSDEAAFLPVTKTTWREVARMSLIADTLIDLGYNKIESGNIVRGYRSGGHPNSKEAKRWKKIEDSPIVMLYQLLNDESNEYRRRMVTARLSAPSKPSCTSSDWRFYLHNIRSRNPNSISYIKNNVQKSIAALKQNPQGTTADTAQKYITELERCLSILQQTPPGHSADPGLLNAKKIALDVLDSTRGKFVATQQSKAPFGNHSKEPPRSKMGFLKNYELTSEQYRKLELAKEDYMVNALKLKEELEAKNKDDAAAALSDEEDDEEEGEASEDKPDAEPKPDVEMPDAPSATSENPASNETAVTAEASNEEANRDTQNPASNEAAVTAEASDQEAKQDTVDSTTTLSPNLSSEQAEPAPVKSPNTESNAVASAEESVARADTDSETKVNATEQCGMTSDYEFCADVPSAPEPIRRCLAVVRTLCASASSDPFIYPVDPQLYPGYYESVMSPVSLYDIGNFLQQASQELSSNDDVSKIEQVVTECGRKVRKIFQNSLAYNTGNKEHLTMNSAEEMLRLFERLFFDWVLAPSLPALKDLDDDKCVDSHDDDIMSMVILCDACEGKYNMQRLKPPLKSVPLGEWYCPRCIQGRCWATEDPRIGREVQSRSFSGRVESCQFILREAGRHSLVYCITDDLGSKEFWDLKDVDESIIGDPVTPISFLDALAECPGYSFGRDSGIIGNMLPMVMDPYVDDKAANSALGSVYKDTVASCISLAHPPEELNSSEWVKLLMMLVAKCSSSDSIQELASSLENKEASTLASTIMTFWRARGAKNIVPDIYSESDDESVQDEARAADVAMPSAPSNPNGGIQESDDKMILDNSSRSEADPAVKEICLQDSVESDGVKTNDEEVPDKPSISPEEELRRKNRESALFTKTIRQKKREESLVGHYVQNSLKSTVASFEEDTLSSLVSSTICSQEEGLNTASVRCRESCAFCNLSDMAICSPMCRVPSDPEWNEIFPHAVHERNSYMVAQMPPPPSSADEPEQNQQGTVCIVRVRVGGELITEKANTLDYPSKVLDQPLQQFLPRNPLGFQSELRFRHDSNLSVVTGSLTAHEVCAIAAHRMRKETFLKDRREHCKATMARDAAVSCGKSIPIGQDTCGRTYWLFKAEPKTLFICDIVDSKNHDSPTAKWHRFSSPEAIASVMVGLGKDSPSESLKEAYPDAAAMVKDGSWSTLLMKKALTTSPEMGSMMEGVTPNHQSEEKEDAKVDEPSFVEDEDVLVESEKGSFLWDAVVVDTSKDPSTGHVNGYFVHFKGWSSRYDCWVPRGDRVLEANHDNLKRQSDLREELEINQAQAPVALAGMFAFKSLQQTNWKSSKYLAFTDLYEYVSPRQGASHDEQSLLILKGSILLIEAALPTGAIEYWPDHAALLWSNFVKIAKGPESLLRCILLLEDAISPAFMKPQATQLLSALTRPWRAMGEASVSSVALRVAVLDHSLKFLK